MTKHFLGTVIISGKRLWNGYGYSRVDDTHQTSKSFALGEVPVIKLQTSKGRYRYAFDHATGISVSVGIECHEQVKEQLFQ